MYCPAVEHIELLIPMFRQNSMSRGRVSPVSAFQPGSPAGAEYLVASLGRGRHSIGGRQKVPGCVADVHGLGITHQNHFPSTRTKLAAEIDVLVIGWIIDRVEATQFDKLISPENQACCRYVIDSGQGRQLTLRVKMAVVAQDNVTVFG